MTASDHYIEANKAMLAQLDERERDVANREQAARAEIETCNLDRRSIESDRAVLLKAQALYEQMRESGALSATSSQPLSRDNDGEAGQSRARIGPQRYLILSAIRDSAFINFDRIVEVTRLSARRVRDQLNTDIPVHVETDTEIFGSRVDPAYSLTKAGEQLMVRFEEYRKQKGEPLPTVESVHNRSILFGDTDTDRHDVEQEMPLTRVRHRPPQFTGTTEVEHHSGRGDTEEAEKGSGQEPSASSAQEDDYQW